MSGPINDLLREKYEHVPRIPESALPQFWESSNVSAYKAKKGDGTYIQALEDTIKYAGGRHGPHGQCVMDSESYPYIRVIMLAHFEGEIEKKLEP